MPLYPARNATVINVLDYGVDNTGNNDAIAMINSLIANAPARTAIKIPAGLYKQSSGPMIIDRDQIALVGDGDAFVTQFLVDPSIDPSYALIIGNTAKRLNVTVYGLTFKGRNDTTSTGGGILMQCAQSSLKQVRVWQFGGNGIVVQGYSGGTLNDIYMNDVYLTQNGKNTTTPGDNLVIASTANDCEYHRVVCAGDSGKSTSRYGIQCSGNSQKFVNCHTYFHSSYGFYQNGGSGLQIIGGEYETNAGHNINIGGSASNFSISSAIMFGGATQRDINVSFGDYGSIIGCKCQSATSEKNIHLDNATRVEIVGNSVKGASSRGIEVGGNCTRCTVSNNSIESTGLLISGTNSIFSNNTLSAVNIVEATGADNNLISGNIFYTSGSVTKVGSNTKIFRNPGYTTEARGSASITAAATSVTVTHGLALTPSLNQILITPQTSLGSSAKWWISNATSTQFTINVDVAPGSTITFSWFADVSGF